MGAEVLRNRSVFKPMSDEANDDLGMSGMEGLPLT